MYIATHIFIQHESAYTGNLIGIKFWQVTKDEANDKDYFGEFDGRSLHLLALAGKLSWHNVHYLASLPTFYYKYFPMHSI